MTMQRGRWPRNARTIRNSSSGERSATAIVTIRPTASAASVTPAAMAEKYGSLTSLTTNAAVLVEPRAMACADRCGT
jgi:hypothetical protein